MNLNLISWALKLLEMAGPIQKNIEQSWPHLKNISNEVEAILVIWNGSKPLILAGGPQTSSGSVLYSKLTGNGVDAIEAGKVVSVFEAMDSRFA